MSGPIITAGCLYFRFFLTYLDYFLRWVFGLCKSWQDLDNFIRDTGLTCNSSPEQFSQTVRTRYIWRQDKTFKILKVNYAKHPLVFMFDGRDTCCDGFALFYERLFARLGLSNVSRVYAVTKKKVGITVCVAKVGNYHYAFGHWPVIPLSSNELPDIGKILARGLSSELDFALRASYNSITEIYTQENA